MRGFAPDAEVGVDVVKLYQCPNRRHDRLAFFKYATATTACAVLDSGSHRWSSPVLFNDPFDVPTEADLGFTATDLEAALIAEFQKAVRSDQPLSNPVLTELRVRIRERGPSGEQFAFGLMTHFAKSRRGLLVDSLRQFNEAYRETVPRLRIYCVSEFVDSVLMWVHYSDNHRGVVLELAASDKRDSSLLLAQPVVYQKAPPALPSVDLWARTIIYDESIDWHEYFGQYFYVKDADWACEREWRVISYAPSPEEGYYTDIPFFGDDLLAVYFGAEIDPHDRDHIREVVETRYSHSKLHQAIIDRSARAVTFKRLR